MKKTKKRLTLIIFSALFALIIGELIHSNLFFKTTEYNLKADNINGNLKIVFISDLHNKEYGENSGHTHGGLVRIPFVGGVIALNQGLFPQYDKGEFDFNNTSMIITGGLGVSNPIPRFNNQPEICIINITKGNS